RGLAAILKRMSKSTTLGASIAASGSSTRTRRKKKQGIGVADMAVQSDVNEAIEVEGGFDRARALSAFKLGDVTFYWITRTSPISVPLPLGGITLPLMVGAGPGWGDSVFAFLWPRRGGPRPIRRCWARSGRCTARLSPPSSRC